MSCFCRSQDFPIPTSLTKNLERHYNRVVGWLVGWNGLQEYLWLENQQLYFPSFRYPKMASEAPGGGRQGKPKCVAGPDPVPAGLPGPERGHLPPLGERPPPQGKPTFVAGPDPAPAGLPGPERGHPPPLGGRPPSQGKPKFVAGGAERG